MPKTKIPAPRNALVSFHHFRQYDLDRLAGLRIIGDSGAFSAASKGAVITTDDLASWVKQWRHRLAWVASLDVIGDQEATRRNWHQMVDGHGIPAVPTVHHGSMPQALDYYGQRGVDFVGLGGLVGVPSPRQMRWTLQMFRYAAEVWPDMKFHGWGVTGDKLVRLPFYSVDSSGWAEGLLFGHFRLRDPRTGATKTFYMDGKGVYEPFIANLLRDQYGVNPTHISRMVPGNRDLVIKVSALSISAHEQIFRRKQGAITAPTWGQLNPDTATAGPHMHLALIPSLAPQIAHPELLIGA